MSLRLLCLGWLVPLCAVSSLCSAGCLGTPTPEPPDGDPSQDGGPSDGTPIDRLPPPDEDRIGARVAEITTAGGPDPVGVVGSAGAVGPESLVWLVNLDDARVAPVTVQAETDGSFEASIALAPGDRMRLASRTLSTHSAALDFVTVTGGGAVSIVRAASEEAPCLTLSPGDEIVLRAASDAERNQSFTLHNTCEQEVRITRAALRVGEAGFTLVAPESLVPGQRASLRLGFEQNTGVELAEILLLDAQLSGQSYRYVRGVWAR